MNYLNHSKNESANSQSRNHFNINDYTKYTSVCDILLSHYKNKNYFGLDKKIKQIEDWLDDAKSNKNTPLIIKAAKFESQKMLIINWMYAHIKNSSKDYKNVIIPNFVNYKTKESSFFFLIYNTIIKIREIFNIKQNVHLSEEKLRMNFEYWLDLASRKIKKHTFFDGDLIIIIEGAHLIVEKNKDIESNFKFWLPKYLPERVRMIITLEETSFNLNYFQNIGCSIVSMKSNNETAQKFMRVLRNRDYLPNSSYVNKMFFLLSKLLKKIPDVTNFFVEVYISCLIPYFKGGQSKLEEKVFQKIVLIFQNKKKVKKLITELEGIENL